MLSDSRVERDIQPKQARSKARRKTLLEHGVTLFNSRGLDDVSIQDITRAVGFSTGSFYSYFADKAEFFVAVQVSVAADQDARVQAVFSEHDLAALSLSERLELCVAVAIDYFRRHTGLVHAALSYERRIPAGWQPNRKTTAIIIETATTGLPAGKARILEVAIQLAYGLLVNTLLHDPGPLRLQDADLAERVMDALTPYLDSNE